MPHLYNENAAKKPTNLSINSDLLAKVKKLKEPLRNPGTCPGRGAAKGRTG